MFFSIITVVLNNAKGIERTIQSVINQTYKNIEYIIIDGSSTDGTLDFIEKYKNSISKFISEPDMGIYDAMNKGSAIARGDVLYFLNSGDYLFDNHVILEVENHFSKYDPDVLYGKIFASDNNQSFISGAFRSKHDFRKGLLPDHQATFIKKSIFKDFGPYDLNYPICSDYDLMYKLFSVSSKFYFFDRIIAGYQLGGISKNDYTYLVLIYKYFGYIPYQKVKLRRKITKIINVIHSIIR